MYSCLWPHVLHADWQQALQQAASAEMHCAAAAAGPYDVTLVSPRNYFLYTPLLPSAATGTVEPRSIVDPVRSHIPDTVAAAA